MRLAMSDCGPSAKWRQCLIEVRLVGRNGLDLLALSLLSVDPERTNLIASARLGAAPLNAASALCVFYSNVYVTLAGSHKPPRPSLALR